MGIGQSPETGEKHHNKNVFVVRVMRQHSTQHTHLYYNHDNDVNDDDYILLSSEFDMRISKILIIIIVDAKV